MFYHAFAPGFCADLHFGISHFSYRFLLKPCETLGHDSLEPRTSVAVEMHQDATSLMFKLSCKITQDGFLEQLNQQCGISKCQYNFVHLPWKQLAIVNFTRSEICHHCFHLMKEAAGTPGLCIADVQGGMHQGLEANLAYFCAKCSHQSDYKTMPLILVNGEEVPLALACRLFVSESLLAHYMQQLQARGTGHLRKERKGKVNFERVSRGDGRGYQGASTPEPHFHQLNSALVPASVDGVSTMVFRL